jgi:transcriptional regulator with XRE-family HTH domain
MPGPGNVGDRVRNLRLTRRLSQAQLAGHDLSDSYISLIESGKRTPTPAVLRLLAERLGCTPEYLSEGIEPEQRAHLEVRERYARLTLLGGDPAVALEGFHEVISGSDDQELTLRAHWGRARALERLGRIEAAICVFEELREQADRDPGRLSSLPALVALARCYHAVGDLGQAIALGERVISMLHALKLHAGGEHTEAGRVLLLAYVDRSDPGRAHRLGSDVLAVGRPSEDSVAEAYRRASELALERGAVGDALFLADRALEAEEEGTGTRAQARLHMAAARALLRGVSSFGDAKDPAAEAMDLLRDAAGSLDGGEAVDCAIETARAMVLLGRPEEAIAAMERQLTDLGQAGDTSADREPGGLDALEVRRELQIVQARLVLAHAKLAQDDRGTALDILRDAADRLDHLGREAPKRPVAHVLRELGELFEEAGDMVGATAAYRNSLEAAGLRASSRPQPAAHDLGLV